MYRHARNTMLNLPVDYHMNQEDIKAWQHQWTQSIRAVEKIGRTNRWSKLKYF